MPFIISLYWGKGIGQRAFYSFSLLPLWEGLRLYESAYLALLWAYFYLW